MALSPEQIAEIRKNAGLSEIPPPPGVNPDDIISQRKSALAAAAQTRQKAEFDAKPHLGQGIAGDVSAGALGSLMKTGSSVEKVLDQTVGRVGNAIAGNGFTPTHTGADTEQRAEDITDKNLATKVGDVAATVAPYLVGAGEAEGAATGVARIAGNIAKNTALGTAQTGDPVQGVETGVGGEALGALGKPISAAGKAIYKGLSVPVDATEAQMLQAYKANVPFLKRVASAITGNSSAPTTAAETAFKAGLVGTESGIGVQAKRATGNLWKGIIAPALKRSGLKVNMSKFFDEAEEKIIADTPELSRQGSLKEALDALREDYKDVGDVDIADLQDFKSGWAQDVPDKAYRGKPIAGAFRDVKNQVAALARQKIYEAVGPEAKQAYIDYGNLKSIEEWGQKAMTGGKFKGGAGSFLSALKDMVLVPIATIGGQTVYRAGEGLELVGPAGMRYASDLFNEESQP